MAALDNTLGAIFIGVVVAATLHGVSCIQAFFYYTHQTDTWSIKGLVAAVMVFDTLHQALITHSVYTYTITEWGNPPALGLLVRTMLVEVLINGFTALLVQGFLALRVWRLSNRNYWLTTAVMSLVLGEFGFVVVYTSRLTMQTFAELKHLKTLSLCINAFAAAGDALITGSLCTMLHRSRTGFHRSDSMINKLIIFSVNTGLVTSLCAIASLISMVSAGDTFIYIGFFFCIGRLYTNSLLATLNSRKRIRATGSGVNTSGEISHALRDLPKSSVIDAAHMKNISIKIDTTQEFARDAEREKNAEFLDLENSESTRSGSMRGFDAK